MLLSELVYFVTVTFTMTERADQTMRPPILQLSCRLFWQSITSPRSVSPRQPRFGSLQPLAFPRDKISFERKEICECDGHAVHKLSHRCLTADWLAPWESDCSRVHIKVSSDWLPSYIKATLPVLEIFKMFGYFSEQPLYFLWLWPTQFELLAEVS